MFASLRNSVPCPGARKKRNRSRDGKKQPPTIPASPNPTRKQRSRHSYASGPTASRARSRSGSRSGPLEVAFSSLSLEEQGRELEKCEHFKKNLGKLLRAHDHNWRKVPFFFFVDEWISDEGQTIAKNRLKQAHDARRKYGIAN